MLCPYHLSKSKPSKGFLKCAGEIVRPTLSTPLINTGGLTGRKNKSMLKGGATPRLLPEHRKKWMTHRMALGLQTTLKKKKKLYIRLVSKSHYQG